MTSQPTSQQTKERTESEPSDQQSESRQIETPNKQNEKTSCSECQSTDLLKASGETICADCGLVLRDDQIDRGPEWRAFDRKDRDEKSRVGAPMTEMMHDRGLSTNIGWQDKDAYGNQISGKRRSQIERLRTWQERTRTSSPGDRNLKYALGEIDRMASGLGIPKEAREMSSVIYRRALNENMLKGRSIEGMSTGALYAACRQASMPRTLDELTEVSRVGYEEIGRSYRYLSQELGLELAPVDPKSYIPRFASDLDLGQEVQAKANEILDECIEAGALSGKSPPGFAAAAIYGASLLCNEKRTQEEVKDVANVSTVTIRNRYHQQFEIIGLL